MCYLVIKLNTICYIQCTLQYYKQKIKELIVQMTLYYVCVGAVLSEASYTALNEIDVHTIFRHSYHGSDLLLFAVVLLTVTEPMGWIELLHHFLVLRSTYRHHCVLPTQNMAYL